MNKFNDNTGFSARYTTELWNLKINSEKPFDQHYGGPRGGDMEIPMMVLLMEKVSKKNALKGI